MNAPLTTQNTPSWEMPSLMFDAAEALIESAAESLEDATVVNEVIYDWADPEVVTSIVRAMVQAVNLNQKDGVVVWAKALVNEIKQGSERRQAQL